MIKQSAFFLLAWLFLCSSAHALSLSSSDIDRFISTTQLLTPYLDAMDDDDDMDDEDIEIFNVERIKKLIVDSVSESKDMTKIVKANGYHSVDAYAEQYAIIMMAYLVTSGREQFRELELEMEIMDAEQRRDFESSPLFHMLSLLKKQFDSVPESHIKAIAPYMLQLSDVFEVP